MIRFTTNECTLLYCGSKFFWKQSETVGLHIYLHNEYHVVEVIPQCFSIALREAQDARSKAVSSPVMSVAKQKSDGPVAVTAAALSDGAGVRDRLYLDYNILAHNIADVVTKNVNVQLFSESGKGKYKVEEEKRARLIEQTTEKCLLNYVITGLQLDPISKQIFFEPPSPDMPEATTEQQQQQQPDQIHATTKKSNPTLPFKPFRLVRATIEADKIFQLWEIQQKMGALEKDQEELSKAVSAVEKHVGLLKSAISGFESCINMPRLNKNLADLPRSKQNFLRGVTRLIRRQRVLLTVAVLEELEKPVEEREEPRVLSLSEACLQYRKTPSVARLNV